MILGGIKTCDPDYYRWTQWIFLRLLKRGLAYRKNGMVNWDPVDETVLADEQVDHSGRSWRSGVVVERRPLVQWYLRITAYIPEMLDVLKCSVSDPSSDLARWPSGIREMQRNWILGSAADKLQDNMKSLDRSKNFDHEIELEQKNLNLNIEKSINRPVTSLDGLLNDESKSETNHWPKVKDTRNLVDSRGFKSVDRHQNHENGAIQTDFLANKTDEKSASFKSEHWKIRDWLISRQRRWGTPIPIIHCKGCGIIPVKEEDLPVTLEMQSEPITRCPSCGKIDDVQRDPDTMDTFVDSSWYYLRLADPNNRDLPISIESLRENLPVDTYIGGSEHAVMHLLYARFIYRFMIDEISGKFDRLNQFHRFYDSDLVKQANNDLANCLPDTIRAHSNELMPNEILKNDLKFSINYFADGKAFDLNNSKLDTSCGEHYSSRHTSEPLSSQNILNEEKERFSLNKIAKEPFKKLLVQGIVEAETFKCLKTGRYLRVEDAHKHEHTRQWEKMSKSKGNGVDPVHLINVYGADSLRLLILFKAPPGIGIQWRECDIAGPSRWLMRVVALVDKICAQRQVDKLTLILIRSGHWILPANIFSIVCLLITILENV